MEKITIRFLNKPLSSIIFIFGLCLAICIVGMFVGDLFKTKDLDAQCVPLPTPDPGTQCGFYFSGIIYPCMGMNPSTSCPGGYTQKCWKHGGKYALDSQCTCFKN